jgi:hypothetical protein
MGNPASKLEKLRIDRTANPATQRPHWLWFATAAVTGVGARVAFRSDAASTAGATPIASVAQE